MSDARLRHAETIAREVGVLAQTLRADPSGLKVDVKGPQDFVTAADLAVETRIREALGDTYPNDAVLGEEEGLVGDTDACWILDPIDGTTNFMRGLPDWAISIGYFDGTALTHGVIFAPDQDVMLSAVKGGPALRNGAPIKVRDPHPTTESLIAVGFSRRTGAEPHLGDLNRMIESGADYRRCGAATISLLGVATGSLDAYFERRMNVWDCAAGIVIVEAAGGRAYHPAFPDFLTNPGEILVMNQSEEIAQLFDR